MKMKNLSNLLPAVLLSVLLASCASRTMDSVPTLAELNAYEQVIRARYKGMYDELEHKRSKGEITQAEYAEQKQRLDAKVTGSVNNAAWNKHFLAESERKSDNVPTPDHPVALSPGQVGGYNLGGTAGSVGSGSMGSFYRPSYQNYGAVTGMGGSAGMGSIRGASDQLGKAQSTRNDAMSAGGSFLSAPPVGSIYDEDVRR